MNKIAIKNLQSKKKIHSEVSYSKDVRKTQDNNRAENVLLYGPNLSFSSARLCICSLTPFILCSIYFL